MTPETTDSDSSDSSTAANRRPNVIPDPQNKWLVDSELQCCGFVIEDVRTDSKTDSTDTASGNGPTHGVCPDCGNWMVPFEYQNVRRLHQWCEDCEVWYLADEGHECEPETTDGGQDVDRSELVEGHDPSDVETGEKILESPLTGNTYRVTKWVDQGDGEFVAIEKELVEDDDDLVTDGGTEQESAGDKQPKGTLIRVTHGSRSTWHHSVSFDGREHGTACGMAVDTDDIETVIMDVEEFQDVDGRECCDECAGSVRSLVEDWRGLHEKYEVYEDGDRVEDCFVLEPNDDQAARAALIKYAKETDNEELAQDLRDWVVDICTDDEQFATDGGRDSDDVECSYCDREALAYEMESGRGVVVRCIPCLAIEQGQQQLEMPFEEFVDNSKHEDSIVFEDAEDWREHRRLSYESAQDWLKVLARIQDDDPILKRDPDATGTLHEHTRAFLTNIMGSEAHHPPSEVAGRDVHAAQVQLGDTDA